MKPEATSSQTGEVTQLAEFPWRFLPSMLSQLVHYRHLVLSARVITLVTITQLCFMPYTLKHLRVSFLVHVFSQNLHSNVLSSTSLWFLLKCALRVPFLVHTYLHRSHVFCLSLCYDFRAFIFVFFFFLVYLYLHWVHSCWSLLSISTFTLSYHKVPTGNKGSTILTGISGIFFLEHYLDCTLLIPDRPLTSPANFPFSLCYMWHLTPDAWHMTHDK